jgi:hypothetical protein
MPFSLADLLNSPTDYEFEGTVYKLRQAALEECGQYQRWLEQEARASAGRATELPEEDRRNLLRDTNADIAAQVYAWGGEMCVKSLRTPQGFAKLLSIACADQGLTYRKAQEMVGQRLRELSELVLGAVEEDPTGKVLRALLSRTGRPPSFFAPSSSDCATPPPESPATSSPSDGSAPGS